MRTLYKALRKNARTLGNALDEKRAKIAIHSRKQFRFVINHAARRMMVFLSLLLVHGITHDYQAGACHVVLFTSFNHFA